MAKFRIERINEEIKKALSYFVQNDLKDPIITGLITVTRVDTTSDLKHCKVYLSILDKNKDKVFDVCKKCIGGMRKSIANKVKIRAIPEIQLKLDESIEYSFHISDILKKSTEKDF